MSVDKKKILILADNTGLKAQSYWYYYRSMAANELRRRITLAGYECIVIEWFKSWSHQDLKKLIDIYFNDTKNPIIAISSTFEDKSNISHINPVLEYAKSKFSNLIVIHGGQKYFAKKHKHIFRNIDINFLSRSMGMFDDWLQGNDISKYVLDKDPLILANNNVDRKTDTPLLYQLYDDELLTKNESLGFEIGIGCRFNCIFCDYELRNAKTVILTESQKLKKLFLDSYEKYGIQNFYCIDDTANESYEKLQILYDAIKDLPYKPQISAWCRLDLLNKPRQREFFKKINFSAVFFGIESFKPEACKFVRKKTSMDDVFDSLTFMRDECPDTFTLGSFIIGLPGDSYDSIVAGFEKAAKEKLLDAISMYPYELGSYQWSTELQYTDASTYSEIEKNPEKYGFKLQEIEFVWEGRKVKRISWQNDWIDYSTAVKMTSDLRQKFFKNFFLMNHSEVAALRFHGIIKNKGSEEDKKMLQQLHEKASKLSDQYINEYVEKRKKQLGI